MHAIIHLHCPSNAHCGKETNTMSPTTFRCVLVVLFSAMLVNAAQTERFALWKTVGVLSQGDFDTIHHLVPNATAVVKAHKEDLYAAVDAGEVDAGLISGMPNATRFNVYPSGNISPRAMLTRKNDTATRQIIDAGIVRLQMSRVMFDYAAAHAPFSFVELTTCRTVDPDTNIPLPNASVARVIKVGGIGPYDWHQDGNYTASPPEGFWPDFLTGLGNVLPNITFERVFFNSSANMMAALETGVVDTSEPYWTVDSLYKDMPRVWTFEAGCTTLGYQSNFFTMVPSLEAAATSESSDKPYVLPLAITAGVLAVVALVFITYMITRERRGSPVFNKSTLLLQANSNSNFPSEMI